MLKRKIMSFGPSEINYCKQSEFITQCEVDNIVNEILYSKIPLSATEIIHRISELNINETINIKPLTMLLEDVFDQCLHNRLDILGQPDCKGQLMLEKANPIISSILKNLIAIHTTQMKRTSSNGFRSHHPMESHPKPNVEIIFAGHRGSGANCIMAEEKNKANIFPENTISSFRNILDKQIDAIEFDLYLSADNKLMVIHDNDLSVNAKYIYGYAPEEQKGQPRYNPYFFQGKRLTLNPQSAKVNKYSAYDLQQRFDVSQGFGKTDEMCKIPTFKEVLNLVASYNTIRKKLGIDKNIILNAELKGPGTGKRIIEEINQFNFSQRRNPERQIPYDDFYFLSFFPRELLEISKNCNDAHLVLGISTAMQYTQVDDKFSISDSSNLNNKALTFIFEDLHEQLKKIRSNKKTGLTAVDIPFLDISDLSINYFNKKHGIPMHISVTPLGKTDLLGAKYASLENINKLNHLQNKFLKSGGHKIIIKTDDYLVLKASLDNLNNPEIKEIERPNISLPRFKKNIYY